MATQVQASSTAAPAPRRRRQNPYALPLLFLLPSLALILFIYVYPMFTGFLYSLQDGTLIKPGEFVALQNYVKVLQSPDFASALRFSLVFALFSVFGSYAIGLVFALLLNQDVPARGFFRVALLLPWIIPSVVSIVSWRWMIADQFGLVNRALGLVGLGPIFFLSSEDWAIFSVILVKVWRSFPFMMLSILAALQAISAELYEAAAIDGANRWQSFRYITMPHLKNLSIVLWILMTIWSVNDFDTPWLLTQGGPSRATENLIVLAYRTTFGSNDVGIGSAIAFITMLILMVLAYLMLRRQSEAA
ncbi:MAG TPA: sugar ABC transporter permease [Caldilineaceae bacterium]|nr:sugar ABC transporter permease [Caldilineaceae bacterium]